MTATIEAPTTLDTVEYKVTVALAGFLNLIGNLPLFASKDDTLPVLNAVKLWVEGDMLHGGATDRYRLAEVKVKAEVDEELGQYFKALVSTATIKAWLPALKAEKHSPTIELVVTASRSSEKFPYHPETFGYRLPTGGTATAGLVDGDYPQIQKLYRDSMAHTLHGDPTFSFNPVYLTDFSKVKNFAAGRSKTNEPLTMFLGGGNTKPAEIHIGDWFRGMLMPVRQESEKVSESFASWR